MNRQAPTRKCILVIGAGRTGSALCQRLPESWEIVVLDLDPQRLVRLRAEVPAQRPLRLLQRDGTSLLNLREAGLAGAEWVAALTSDDQVNIDRAEFLRREAPRLDCGCLVVRKRRPGLLSRISLLRPAYAGLLDALPAPVLLAAGTTPTSACCCRSPTPAVPRSRQSWPSTCRGSSACPSAPSPSRRPPSWWGRRRSTTRSGPCRP